MTIAFQGTPRYGSRSEPFRPIGQEHQHHASGDSGTSGSPAQRHRRPPNQRVGNLQTPSTGRVLEAVVRCHRVPVPYRNPTRYRCYRQVKVKLLVSQSETIKFTILGAKTEIWGPSSAPPAAPSPLNIQIAGRMNAERDDSIRRRC